MTSQSSVIQALQQTTQVVEMVFCRLPTDQDVVQVDCHSGKITCELVHDILEVPGSGADAKWKPRLKKDPSVCAQGETSLALWS